MSKLPHVFAALVLAFAIATPAWAYIDPGSGSMILQGLLAALAAIAITAKLWWHRLLVFLHIRKPTRIDPDDPESTGTRDNPHE